MEYLKVLSTDLDFLSVIKLKLCHNERQQSGNGRERDPVVGVRAKRCLKTRQSCPAEKAEVFII